MADVFILLKAESNSASKLIQLLADIESVEYRMSNDSRDLCDVCSSHNNINFPSANSNIYDKEYSLTTKISKDEDIIDDDVQFVFDSRVSCVASPALSNLNPSCNMISSYDNFTTQEANWLLGYGDTPSSMRGMQKFAKTKPLKIYANGDSQATLQLADEEIKCENAFTRNASTATVYSDPIVTNLSNKRLNDFMKKNERKLSINEMKLDMTRAISVHVNSCHQSSGSDVMNPSSPVEQRHNLSPLRFKAEIIGRGGKINHTLLYHDIDKDIFYRFVYIASTSPDVLIYRCSKCKEMGHIAPIKVSNGEFLGDPSCIDHVCSGNQFSKNIVKTRNKKDKLLRKGNKSCNSNKTGSNVPKVEETTVFDDITRDEIFPIESYIPSKSLRIKPNALYRIPQSELFYRFAWKRCSSNDVVTYQCIACKTKKRTTKGNVLIKAKNGTFLSDPCLLPHVCKPITLLYTKEEENEKQTVLGLKQSNESSGLKEKEDNTKLLIKRRIDSDTKSLDGYESKRYMREPKRSIPFIHEKQLLRMNEINDEMTEGSAKDDQLTWKDSQSTEGVYQDDDSVWSEDVWINSPVAEEVLLPKNEKEEAVYYDSIEEYDEERPWMNVQDTEEII